jgi:tRNA-dihydrouridine synthase 1
LRKAVDVNAEKLTALVPFLHTRRPYIKAIKEALKVPVLANGDIRSLAEAQACLEATGADGVLSAEPLLSNPALFSDPPAFPPPSDGHAPIPLDGVGGVDLMIEYFDICRAYSTPFSYIRGHVWKLVGHWMSEFTDLRDEFVVFRHPADLDGLTAWGEKMRARILEVERTTGRRRPVPKKSERALAREAAEEAKRAAMDEAKREEDALRGTCRVVRRARRARDSADEDNTQIGTSYARE